MRIDDRRILLPSPRAIKVNDRFARNGDHIVSLEETAEGDFTVATKHDSILLPDRPVYVWRIHLT